jgi:hypothetical protein
VPNGHRVPRGWHARDSESSEAATPAGKAPQAVTVGDTSLNARSSTADFCVDRPGRPRLCALSQTPCGPGAESLGVKTQQDNARLQC